MSSAHCHACIREDSCSPTCSNLGIHRQVERVKGCGWRASVFTKHRTLILSTYRPIFRTMTTFDLPAYQVSLLHGFLPEEPLRPLRHPQYRHWEAVSADLPRLIRTRTVQQAILNLPIVGIDQLQDENDWRRAYSVLAFLAHAWIWGSGVRPNEASANAYHVQRGTNDYLVSTDCTAVCFHPLSRCIFTLRCPTYRYLFCIGHVQLDGRPGIRLGRSVQDQIVEQLHGTGGRRVVLHDISRHRAAGRAVH